MKSPGTNCSAAIPRQSPSRRTRARTLSRFCRSSSAPRARASWKKLSEALKMSSTPMTAASKALPSVSSSTIVASSIQGTGAQNLPTRSRSTCGFFAATALGPNSLRRRLASALESPAGAIAAADGPAGLGVGGFSATTWSFCAPQERSSNGRGIIPQGLSRDALCSGGFAPDRPAVGREQSEPLGALSAKGIQAIGGVSRRKWTESRHNTHKFGDNRLLCAAGGERFEPHEVIVEPGRAVRRSADYLHNLRNRRGRRPFIIVEQLLAELLSRAQAGEFDTNLFARDEAREPDKMARHIHHFNRPPHVESVKRSAGLEGRRVQHEVDRLRYGHEEALHFGMGHRNRATRADLREKLGNDAAIAAEHVAEPDHGEAGAAPPAEMPDDKLAGALGRAHHARRVDRLVGRDQDDAFGAVARGVLGHRPRAAEIVFDRFTHVELDQWHVLVRRRVKDNLRAVALENFAETHPVGGVAQQRNELALAATRAELVVDRIQGVLVTLEHQQKTGLERTELSAELRANRPAGTGHEDAASRDQAAQRARVEPGRPALQQVFQRDIANLADGDGAVQQVAQVRQGFYRQLVRLERADDLAQESRLGASDRHQDLVRGMARDDLR